jgi:BRCA1 C Terminus (BRCT) domain
MTIIELDSSVLRSTVALTGRLACMSRAKAFDMVRQHGGTPSQAVTRQTNVLVVGELGWPLLDDGRPSNKLSRASSYGIPVISERRFLEWIGKATPDSLHRTYSADQIASLSKLSSSTIDELVRFGLLDPRGSLFGFRDLASARQISKLFAHGIALSEIIRSVNEIREWLPEADLSNLRLHPATPHDLEIEQPEGRTDKRGQFVMPVRPPEQNSDALFEQAQSAEETEDIAEAERLYRVLMKCDPTDAAAPFNLGNMLRVDGRKTEAEAAFVQRRALIRCSPRLGITFLTCWMSKADQKPRSIVCVGRCKLRRTTLMRYSISRCCFNETTSTRRLRSTGGAILPMTLNPNGQHVRAGL